ncbi:MAG: restriction endonuclease subunit R [Firmicutes bacterium]|nr:restriction endonuclease subunit R [Bacillota bacterium]
MKLKFKQQAYQDEAVRALIDCFLGQKKRTEKSYLGTYENVVNKGTLLEKKEFKDIVVYSNASLNINDLELRENIRSVQYRGDISYTDEASLDNFSIEMETGTGKTYTYIKTMYELNKTYGWSKFIIMVPSIAIREGVLKTFQVTEDHFQEIYKKKIRYFVYNSAIDSNIVDINNFSVDNSIQVMIINYQAFSSKSLANRKIYDELDDLQSRRPIDVIKATRPILIIDEPQKFGDKTENLFQEFNPLFIVRYSATHKKDKEYNKIYILDAIDAYNQKLVKKIKVKGLELINNNTSNAYIYLDKVEISKESDPIAYIEIDVKGQKSFSKKIIRVKSGDDLYKLSNQINAYHGFVVDEIDARNMSFDKVSFKNGFEITSGQVWGNLENDELIRIQIRETIESHLQKEQVLFKMGIKVLSLFFIDEVSKYKYYENNIPLKGKYALIFESEYQKALKELKLDEAYQQYLASFQNKTIHAGYFSIDKKGRSVEPKINDKQKYLSYDDEAYDLIMKDKERLLSLEEPVRFIFSHSALREGWDNPNIFQICTLKKNNSEISKRQEIGRGLRICVNKNGERMDESVLGTLMHSINTLTLITSVSYEEFAKNLQNEISLSLTKRPNKLTIDYLKNKELINETGEKLEFNDYNILEFMMMLKNKTYLDENFHITNFFQEEVLKEKVDFLNFNNFKKEIIKLLQKVYNVNNYEISNERKEHLNNQDVNNNFKLFEKMWNSINYKSYYEVKIDSEKLEENAIKSINENLYLKELKIKKIEGEQINKIDQIKLNNKETMRETSLSYINISNNFVSDVLYDLVGSISKSSFLTRKTVSNILMNIDALKFDLFKQNPEEFIQKVSLIINQEKALLIKEGIKYYKLNSYFDDKIFAIKNLGGIIDQNLMRTKKNIYDYLKYDSEVEKKFAQDLEISDVLVYAKLPTGFKISTPVGDYNPDWAIVLKNNEFYIIETKGSMNKLSLRASEELKIACAKHHFALNNINYEVVNNYDEFIEIINKKVKGK